MHAFGPEGSQGTRGEPAWKPEEHAHRKASGSGRSEPKTLLLRRLKCIKPGLHSHQATETMVYSMFGAILFLGNDDFSIKTRQTKYFNTMPEIPGYCNAA